MMERQGVPIMKRIRSTIPTLGLLAWVMALAVLGLGAAAATLAPKAAAQPAFPKNCQRSQT